MIIRSDSTRLHAHFIITHETVATDAASPCIHTRYTRERHATFRTQVWLCPAYRTLHCLAEPSQGSSYTSAYRDVQPYLAERKPVLSPERETLVTQNFTHRKNRDLDNLGPVFVADTLCRICVVQIQPRKHVLDHADRSDRAALTWQDITWAMQIM